MSAHVSFGSPLEFGNGTVIKNRFFKSAMSEQLADRHHNPTPELARLYRTWAAGGVGISMTGNVMIDRNALGEPKNVVLDEASDVKAFRRWAAEGTRNAAHLWVQLNHPGKQTPRFLSREPVAPSAIPLGKGLEKAFNPPRELGEDEILAIIEKFAFSARLAKEAGFTGVQIHGAHGYLVSQFLSPRHNRRTDRWGGNSKNRRRFVLEIYRAMRKAVGENYPVSIKLNSADFMNGGFTETESIKVVKALADEGIDLIEVSGGTYESPSMTGHGVRESTRRREAYFLEFAEQIRKMIDTPLVVTGGFRSGPAMADALESGALDMIGLARPMAVQPDLPNRLLANPNHSLHVKRPSTGWKWLDRMSMLDITWYEQQLARLARGRQADIDQSAWTTIMQTVAETGAAAFRQRRA